ncbi:hypothetical protein GCM10010919_16420 [Alishewanella longhuensis]|uniref:Uncharacterized protein n=1 Tax=Alishewanella longhuensis TaxID=1091037 RepID=A0ABQ3KX87_9ALTE|nr:hypothetical protein [Alishewanella longhuensis]GHG67607.1 hypothetical protein GCM10010919_16420 [Alishewanella longhuensis]
MQTALVERRQLTGEMQPFWDELNLAQKFAITELERYGYELVFVRYTSSGSLAVLRLGERFAVIDEHGEIDSAPKIAIRH